MLLDGFTPYKKEDSERYNRLRWWAGLTIGDILDKAADIYPEKEALVDSRSRLTYSRLREKSNRLAIGLIELGIQSQDRVLVHLPNWNEFLYTYFAVQKIGAIPVLLIDRYRQYEINHLCKLTKAKAWVVPEQFGKIDYIPIIEEVRNKNPDLKHVILVRGEGHESFSNIEKWIENVALNDKNIAMLASRRPDPMSVAHMGPTGGTTGLPKVVPRTHNDYLCRSEYVARGWELGYDDILLAVAPVGHDLTISIGMLPTIFTFGKIVLLDSVEPDDIAATIEKEQITTLAWTPALAYRLVYYEGLTNYDTGSLKKMYCGGGASSREMIKDVKEKLGCTFINAYGATEGMNVQTRLDYDIEKIHKTVGKPTCPYDTYKIVDDHGQELPPNTSGQLLVKGPGIFTGYYNSPEENENAFDENGFFKTGDLAMIDDSGDIFLTGRIREIIKRGGESISTTEIENLIVTHPHVAAVAVVGMPDPEMGEKACAYIQTIEGLKLNFEEIISYLKSKNASVLQLPERVEFIETLPLTKAGKLDKRRLEEDIINKIGKA